MVHVACRARLEQEWRRIGACGGNGRKRKRWKGSGGRHGGRGNGGLDGLNLQGGKWVDGQRRGRAGRLRL
eukprot:scaffold250644_cov26-Tisochrysis_lutea.AAC.1